MKVRIKFRKYGNMKFIGHLDVMRYFQKAIRRAGVGIRYSEGFSPHQLMSFAAPLGVGVTSNGEYVDIQVSEEENVSTMADRLNSTMAEGFDILSCRRLPDQGANAMASVCAADYTVRLRPGYGPFGRKETKSRDFLHGLLEFYQRDQIPVVKKTKRGQKELDLKPLVYELKLMDDLLFMKVSSGSAANVKPDLVLAAYYDFLGREKPDFAWMFQREEVYTDLAGQEDQEKGIHHFVSLESIGQSQAQQTVSLESLGQSQAQEAPPKEAEGLKHE